jgi:hypothetical protein
VGVFASCVARVSHARPCVNAYRGPWHRIRPPRGLTFIDGPAGASAEEASGRAGLCTPSAVHTVVEDAHAPASPPRRGHPPIKLPPLTPTGVPGGTSGGLPAFSGSPRGDQRVAVRPPLCASLSLHTSPCRTAVAI